MYPQQQNVNIDQQKSLRREAKRNFIESFLNRSEANLPRSNDNLISSNNNLISSNANQPNILNYPNGSTIGTIIPGTTTNGSVLVPVNSNSNAYNSSSNTNQYGNIVPNQIEIKQQQIPREVDISTAAAIADIIKPRQINTEQSLQSNPNQQNVPNVFSVNKQNPMIEQNTYSSNSNNPSGSEQHNLNISNPFVFTSNNGRDDLTRNSNVLTANVNIPTTKQDLLDSFHKSNQKQIVYLKPNDSDNQSKYKLSINEDDSDFDTKQQCTDGLPYWTAVASPPLRLMCDNICPAKELARINNPINSESAVVRAASYISDRDDAVVDDVQWALMEQQIVQYIADICRKKIETLRPTITNDLQNSQNEIKAQSSGNDINNVIRQNISTIMRPTHLQQVLVLLAKSTELTNSAVIGATQQYDLELLSLEREQLQVAQDFDITANRIHHEIMGNNECSINNECGITNEYGINNNSVVSYNNSLGNDIDGSTNFWISSKTNQEKTSELTKRAEREETALAVDALIASHHAIMNWSALLVDATASRIADNRDGCRAVLSQYMSTCENALRFVIETAAKINHEYEMHMNHMSQFIPQSDKPDVIQTTKLIPSLVTDKSFDTLAAQYMTFLSNEGTMVAQLQPYFAATYAVLLSLGFTNNPQIPNISEKVTTNASISNGTYQNVDQLKKIAALRTVIDETQRQFDSLLFLPDNSKSSGPTMYNTAAIATSTVNAGITVGTDINHSAKLQFDMLFADLLATYEQYSKCKTDLNAYDQQMITLWTESNFDTMDLLHEQRLAVLQSLRTLHDIVIQKRATVNEMLTDLQKKMLAASIHPDNNGSKNSSIFVRAEVHRASFYNTMKLMDITELSNSITSISSSELIDERIPVPAILFYKIKDLVNVERSRALTNICNTTTEVITAHEKQLFNDIASTASSLQHTWSDLRQLLMQRRIELDDLVLKQKQNVILRFDMQNENLQNVMSLTQSYSAITFKRMVCMQKKYNLATLWELNSSLNVIEKITK